MGHQQDDLPAATGEAAEHQVSVQGGPIQGQDDGEATTDTNGLSYLNQTRSADVQSQVQRDSNDDPGPLQGQFNRQQSIHCNHCS